MRTWVRIFLVQDGPRAYLPTTLNLFRDETNFSQGKRTRLSTEDSDTTLNGHTPTLTDDDAEVDGLEDETESSDQADVAPDKENALDGVNGNAQPSKGEVTNYAELDDETAMQALRTEIAGRPRVENHAAPNAIIEEVVCTNFMCHEHLSIQVGPLINFIIGHNGSGKSAILTALTICLGGKATATNRGQNLKSFIKEGKDFASLSVKIKNQGESAYRPDVYGKSIIVERTITKSSSGGFKIKNAMGKIVSTKKSDLDEALDFFALQLDNPMNVLTQDMARQFLNNSSATEKYKFFMKGTHLETLDHEYNLTADKLDVIAIQMAEHKEAIDYLQKDVEETARKLEASKHSQALEDRFAKYGRQMAWAQVEEQETILRQLDNAIVEIDHIIQERTDGAEKFSADLEQLDRNVERAAAKVQALQDELKEKEEERAPISEQFNEGRRELQILISDQRRIHAQIEGHRNRMKARKDEIELERQRLAAADNGAHARKMEEIQVAKNDLEQSRSRKQQLSLEMPALRATEKEAQRRLEDAKLELEVRRQAVDEKKAVIEGLERGSHDWMRAYPSTLRDLLRLIDREKGFKAKPVGPIGHHIQLLEPKWSSILETAFGNRLYGFAVSHAEDKSLLLNLMRQAK